jgi:hypothetical protein
VGAVVSESLPVELNAGSVHAIDAPETFTARGPFHLDLANEGGAVHVHVHLGDDLSRAARLRDVNHYVETGETVRVPVGTVPGRGEVTGHLEIVSGYGAERKRIEVTVVADARNDGNDGPQRKPDGEHDGARREPGGETARGDHEPARTVNAATGTSTGHPMERSATGMGVRGLANRSLPDFPVSIETTSREGVAFVGLAAIAATVGVAVILIVDDLLLSLVVAAVVATVVAAAGWLLFEE